MRLFRRRGLGEPEKSQAIALVQHVQTIYAYQQLTMELYNDALLRAGIRSHGRELAHRTGIGQTTNADVERLVLPASQAKMGLVKRMTEIHGAFGRPTSPSLQPAYDDCSRFLESMRKRAEAQYASINEWLGNPAAAGFETLRLDNEERLALDKSIQTLNALIEASRLDPEAWSVLNCAAFNSVRSSQGLTPLTQQEFQERYFTGMAGGTARFFTQENS